MFIPYKQGQLVRVRILGLAPSDAYGFVKDACLKSGQHNSYNLDMYRMNGRTFEIIRCMSGQYELKNARGYGWLHSWLVPATPPTIFTSISRKKETNT